MDEIAVKLICKFGFKFGFKSDFQVEIAYYACGIVTHKRRFPFGGTLCA